MSRGVYATMKITGRDFARNALTRSWILPTTPSSYAALPWPRISKGLGCLDNRILHVNDHQRRFADQLPFSHCSSLLALLVASRSVAIANQCEQWSILETLVPFTDL